MIAPDARGGGFKGGAFGGGYGFDRLRNLISADGQLICCQGDPIELLRQLDHRGIAPCAHILDDPGHGGIHIGAVLALGVQQGGKTILKVGLALI